MIEEILQFWFGKIDSHGMSDPGRNKLWFGSSDEVDHKIESRYGSRVAEAIEGQLDIWADSDQGLMALILLLDQFPRNIHRDTPRAFAGDERALALALGAIDESRHLELPPVHRVFLYLPLEHTEQLAIQQRCVALFEALGAETGLAHVAEFTRYAIAHRDVIARFGRFPHRNAILGRQSTPAELDYLDTHGGF